MKTIFRDDDISHLTNLEEFKKVHEFFNEHNCIHTIALLTKDIQRNPELVKYINSQNNIDVQVHSFEHIEFVFATDDEIRFQLNHSSTVIENLFGKKPTVLYPTFNSVDERVIRIAAECGLETSYKKISTLYYVRHNGVIVTDEKELIVNFHYHDYTEAILIGVALKLYNENK